MAGSRTEGAAGAGRDRLGVRRRCRARRLRPATARRRQRAAHPTQPAWRQVPLGNKILLEHRDLAAWFSAPMIPQGFTGRPPAPPLLARAREELEPLLYPGRIAE